MSNIPQVTLNNGLKMPLEGFGVFKITDLKQCKQAVLDALNTGYRLIDTAQHYENEQAVGSAIAESKVPRSDIFLTTKIFPNNFGYQKTKQSLKISLKKLQTDYLDLVLLHHPFNDYYGAYRALEDLYHEGKIKAIGVSNFYTDRYIDLVHFSNIVPAIDQVETHVFHQRKTLHKYLKKYGTQIESWGPLAQGRDHIFTNPTLVNIGKKYHKTAAQIALKFLAQNKIIIIPKSAHKKRMQQNIDLWDFQLSASDIQNISQLDTGKSQVMDHEDPAFVEQFMKAIDAFEKES